jgi:hypothetical protein
VRCKKDQIWVNWDSSLPFGGDARNCLGNDLSLVAYRLRLLGFNAGECLGCRGTAVLL